MFNRDPATRAARKPAWRALLAAGALTVGTVLGASFMNASAEEPAACNPDVEDCTPTPGETSTTGLNPKGEDTTSTSGPSSSTTESTTSSTTSTTEGPTTTEEPTTSSLPPQTSESIPPADVPPSTAQPTTPDAPHTN